MNGYPFVNTRKNESVSREKELPKRPNLLKIYNNMMVVASRRIHRFHKLVRSRGSRNDLDDFPFDRRTILLGIGLDHNV